MKEGKEGRKKYLRGGKVKKFTSTCYRVSLKVTMADVLIRTSSLVHEVFLRDGVGRVGAVNHSTNTLP
jgi:hypothetical protein